MGKSAAKREARRRAQDARVGGRRMFMICALHSRPGKVLEAIVRPLPGGAITDSIVLCPMCVEEGSHLRDRAGLRMGIKSVADTARSSTRGVQVKPPEVMLEQGSKNGLAESPPVSRARGPLEPGQRDMLDGVTDSLSKMDREGGLYPEVKKGPFPGVPLSLVDGVCQDCGHPPLQTETARQGNLCPCGCHGGPA